MKRSRTRVPDDVRAAVLTRDASICQRCGVWTANVPSSVHHRLPRKMGGRKGAALVDSYDLANLVLLCGTGTSGCHGEIELDRAQAYDDGWLVRESESPRDVACLTFRGSWEKPGSVWTWVAAA